MSKDLEFKIDAFTPETIPQGRLGQYLIELSKLYGEAEGLRFGQVKKGSAILVSVVPETSRPKVEQRLLELRTIGAPSDAVDSYRRLDDMLAIDGSTGLIRGLQGGAVVEFLGRDRARSIEYGPIREEGFIEGEIVRIGGRDSTVHLTVQDGETVYSAIETTRDVARQLGSLIFGPIVRLAGTGTWRRDDEGLWRLDRFVVASFVRMDDGGLADALDRLRAIGGSEWHKEGDPLGTLLIDRHRGGAKIGGRREARKT